MRLELAAACSCYAPPQRYAANASSREESMKRACLLTRARHHAKRVDAEPMATCETRLDTGLVKSGVNKNGESSFIISTVSVVGCQDVLREARPRWFTDSSTCQLLAWPLVVCIRFGRSILISTRLLLSEAFIAESTLGGSLFESEIRKRAASASLLGLPVATEYCSFGGSLLTVAR